MTAFVVPALVRRALMDDQDDLEMLMQDAVEAVQTTLLSLEAAMPMLQRIDTHPGEETGRIIHELHDINHALAALMTAIGFDEMDAVSAAVPITTPPQPCAVCGQPIQL